MLKKLQKIGIAGTAAATTLFSAASAVLASGGAKANAGAGVIGAIDPGKGYSATFGGMISSVLQIVMVVALLLVLLYLILGGIEWITSGGDKGKTESARNKITSAIIGIIILAAAYALVQFVAYLLGFGGFEEALNGIKPINNQ